MSKICHFAFLESMLGLCDIGIGFSFIWFVRNFAFSDELYIQKVCIGSYLYLDLLYLSALNTFMIRCWEFSKVFGETTVSWLYENKRVRRYKSIQNFKTSSI